MIKLLTQTIKIVAISLLGLIFIVAIHRKVEMEGKAKSTNLKEIQTNGYSALDYSLKTRDTINRIIMQNNYTGNFHEIILPKGTIVKSLKIN